MATTDPPSYPGTPRWVKVLGIIGLLLIVAIAVSLVAGVGGEHGPGRHIPVSGAETTAPADSTEVTPAVPGPGGHRSPIQH